MGWRRSGLGGLVLGWLVGCGSSEGMGALHLHETGVLGTERPVSEAECSNGPDSSGDTFDRVRKSACRNEYSEVGVSECRMPDGREFTFLWDNFQVGSRKHAFGPDGVQVAVCTSTDTSYYSCGCRGEWPVGCETFHTYDGCVDHLEPAPESGSGCATVGGAVGSPAWLLALALLGRRRRGRDDPRHGRATGGKKCRYRGQMAAWCNDEVTAYQKILRMPKG